MDQAFLAEFKRRTKAFQSSRGVQEYCWKVYKANKDLVKEFVRWKTLLHIEPDSNEGRGLGFLIHRTHKYHPFRWKAIIESIMAEAVKLPPGLWGTFLLSLVKQHEIRMLEATLAGQEQKHYPEHVLGRRLGQIREFMKDVEKYLGRGEIKRLLGPAAKFMPDWYFIARPENEFYKNECLELVILPLIEREKVRGSKKAATVNELHTLLAKHSWDRYFISHLRPLLRNLSHAIEGEIELRNRIERTSGVEAVRKLDAEVQKDLVKQERFIVELQRLIQRNIPNKEIHGKVEKILTWLLAEANKEIKS